MSTVNDFLAQRDARWMGQVYEFGPGRSAVSSTASTTASGANKACDITYGTNNEFGFDYLRDNMKLLTRWFSGSSIAIVDEVDLS